MFSKFRKTSPCTTDLLSLIDLPNEILVSIFYNLGTNSSYDLLNVYLVDVISLCRLSATCKRFEDVASDSSLWNFLCLKYIANIGLNLPGFKRLEEFDRNVNYKEIFKKELVLEPLMEQEKRLHRVKMVCQ
jgi:hypothetical protein